MHMGAKPCCRQSISSNRCSANLLVHSLDKLIYQIALGGYSTVLTVEDVVLTGCCH